MSKFSGSQLSILVPFLYRDIESLKNLIERKDFEGLAEVIISVNSCGEDYEKLTNLKAPSESIKMIYSKENIGIWKNHEICLKYATKNYVKFVHEDDLINLKGVVIELENCDVDFSIATFLPKYRGSNNKVRENILGRFLVDKDNYLLEGARYLSHLYLFGNSIGPPSCTVYKISALKSIKYWKNDISMDFVMNVSALQNGMLYLSKNAFVEINTGGLRDTNTQKYDLILSRITGIKELLIDKLIVDVQYLDAIRAHIISEYLGFILSCVRARKLNFSQKLILIFQALGQTIILTASAEKIKLISLSLVALRKKYSMEFERKQFKSIFDRIKNK